LRRQGDGTAYVISCVTFNSRLYNIITYKHSSIFKITTYLMITCGIYPYKNIDRHF